MTASTLFFFLIPVGLLATAGILAVGIYSLGKGGAFAKANSNKLMRMRITAQAITIAIVMAFLWFATHGGN